MRTRAACLRIFTRTGKGRKAQFESCQKSMVTEKVPLWKWIFVVSNLIVELPSAVFDQLSSPHKPLYALMAMTLSLMAFLCVTELVYKGVKEGITFKCPRGTIPWFYYPSRSQSHKCFGTFADVIGLACAISQCIVTAINYDFACRAANSPIKFSLLPVIFALGLLCSRILETVEKEASERRDGTLTAVSNLVKEFEQQRQAFEDDAKPFVKGKIAQQSAHTNPNEEL